mmetsp:Transcript_94315/g.149121  ORF Transcript_94315/g.149121 Transcript_94315/m.149121 type:complete len:88 (-) Transcript_94315:124-387(-)
MLKLVHEVRAENPRMAKFPGLARSKMPNDACDSKEQRDESELKERCCNWIGERLCAIVFAVAPTYRTREDLLVVDGHHRDGCYINED